LEKSTTILCKNIILSELIVLVSRYRDLVIIAEYWNADKSISTSLFLITKDYLLSLFGKIKSLINLHFS